MSKFKIKVGKGDRFFYDSENGRISNGHWAVRSLNVNYEVGDKEISGAMMAGKSFVRNSFQGIDFTSKIPDFLAVMEKAWEQNKSLYKPVYQTGWAKISGDDYRIEYGIVEKNGGIPTPGDGVVYLKSEYAKLAEAIPSTLYGRDKESPVFAVDEEFVIGVFMPVTG
jgi:hypothetical protein